MKSIKVQILSSTLILLSGIYLFPSLLMAYSPVQKGTNLYGRTGLLLTDTAQVAAPGQFSVSGNILYSSDNDFNMIHIPFGFNYGLNRQFEFYGNWEFKSIDLDLPPGSNADDSQTGFGLLTVGGRYLFKKQKNVPDIAAAVSISQGPLSSDLGDSGTDMNIKGIVTETISGKILVNGSAGILLEGSRDNDDSDTVFQLSGGVVYPFTQTVSGIAELALNEMGDKNGKFSFGLRSKSKKDLTVQGLIGFGIGSNAPDLTVGGGVQYKF